MLCMCFVQVALACCDVFKQHWFCTVSKSHLLEEKGELECMLSGECL